MTPDDQRPEEPQPPSAAPTDDEVFAQIVAGFTRDEPDAVPRWPVTEDVDPTEAPRRRRTDPEVARDAAPVDDGLPDWVEPDALPDDGHYVPPAPPRLPVPRLRTALATLMVVAGLAVLFVPFRIGLDDSTVFVILGLLLTGGGAALLVNGMREDRWDDGPDDGAVV